MFPKINDSENLVFINCSLKLKNTFLSEIFNDKKHFSKSYNHIDEVLVHLLFWLCYIFADLDTFFIFFYRLNLISLCKSLVIRYREERFLQDYRLTQKALFIKSIKLCFKNCTKKRISKHIHSKCIMIYVFTFIPLANR